MSHDYEVLGPLMLTRFSGGASVGTCLQLTQKWGTSCPCGNGYISIQIEDLPLLIADLQKINSECSERT
jgi:hypothetical protein